MNRIVSETRKGRFFFNIVIYLFLIIWGVVTLYPLLWMFMTSFKTESDFVLHPLALPEQIVFENWVVAWQGASVVSASESTENVDPSAARINFESTIPAFMLNSSIVTFPSLLILAVVTSLAAYSIAHYRFPLRKLFFAFFVAVLAVPVNSVLVSVFLFYASLGLLNSYVGVICIYIAFNISFAVIILTAYFKGFPTELTDAAVIDGCSDLGVFSRIVAPLSKGAISSVAIVNFILIWNELLFANVLIPKLPTLPVGAMRFRQQWGTTWTPMLAGLCIALLPTLIFYLIFHRNLIKGITAGAIKT